MHSIQCDLIPLISASLFTFHSPAAVSELRWFTANANTRLPTAAASHKRHLTWQNTRCRFQNMQRTGLCKCLLRKTVPSSWNSECRPLNLIIKGKLHSFYTLILPVRMSSGCCGLVIIDTKMVAWRLKHVDYYQTGRKDAIKGHCGNCRIRRIWSLPHTRD